MHQKFQEFPGALSASEKRSAAVNESAQVALNHRGFAERAFETQKRETLTNHSVRLNNGVAIARATVPNIARYSMSGTIAPRLVSFSRRLLKPATAYVNGSAFAMTRSHAGKACTG